MARQHPIHRLEQMLQCWEDQCFAYGIVAEHGQRIGWESLVNRIFPYAGPLRHWRELRTHLREIGRHQSALDANRFTTVTSTLAEGLSCLFQYPLFLRDWTVSSRRSFHLDEEAQALISAMSFKGMTWSDLLFPFDSFAITLDVPIQTPLDAYDTILFTKNFIPSALYQGDANSGLSIGLLSTKLETYRRITPLEKDQLWRSGRKGSKSTRDAVLRYLDRFPEPGPFFTASIDQSYVEDKLANEPLVSSSKLSSFSAQSAEDKQIAAPAANIAFRIIAGLCLYLTSLPPKSPHRSEWTTPPSRGKLDPNAITRDADVCLIKSVFQLTAEERAIFLSSATGREQCAHFRRGHYRRRPGEGWDPEAPKIVPVRPTLIREDRLGPGELPGGSTATIST